MIVDQKLNKSFVGVYLIDGAADGTTLATTSKPNWFRRVMTRLFVGWRWVSILKLKTLQQKLKEAKELAEARKEAEAEALKEVEVEESNEAE